MESKNSSLAILHEPFVAGMDENLSPIMQRLWKLEGGAIYFCRSGWEIGRASCRERVSSPV